MCRYLKPDSKIGGLSTCTQIVSTGLSQLRGTPTLANLRFRFQDPRAGLVECEDIGVRGGVASEQYWRLRSACILQQFLGAAELHSPSHPQSCGMETFSRENILEIVYFNLIAYKQDQCGLR